MWPIMSRAASRPASRACRSRDATGDPSSPLYELPLAVERVRAAREAIDQSRADVLLTARAECFLVGHHDALRESVRRLQAFAEAGADVLFAPGPTIPRRSKRSLTRFGRNRINGPGGSGQWCERRRHRGGWACDASVAGGALALAAWTGFHARSAEVEVGREFRRLREVGVIPRHQRVLRD